MKYVIALVLALAASTAWAGQQCTTRCDNSQNSGQVCNTTCW